MPKVLHVIARINRGGTARYLENLIPGLEELGWEVLVVAGNVQHGEIEDPIVKTLPIKKIRHLGRKISPIKDCLARNAIKKPLINLNPTSSILIPLKLAF
jgi:aspartate/glutamate racemase